MNMGSINGLAAKLRNDSPWLLVIHCFNHRLELAVKDAFKGTGIIYIIRKMCLFKYQSYEFSRFSFAQNLMKSTIS